MSAIEETAARLRAAYLPGAPIAPISAAFREGDIESAYAVQAVNTRYWLGEKRRMVGRKIGLTSKVVQQQFGIDQPDYGILFADTDMSGREIDSTRLIQPRMEAEIALVLGRDLTSTQLTLADVMSAVDYVVAALEVVDSRIADWKIGILDTIADNGSNGMFVLGAAPRKLTDIDLAGCGMAMIKNGATVSVGVGAACLGHPLFAAKWLAETMAKTDYPLRAGDIILSGALGPMVEARPGDMFEAHITGLGSVRGVMSSKG